MFFDAWDDVLRVVIVGAAAYGLLILVLRLSGKRTLAKMNAFDLIVTVALGSTLATIALSGDVPLAEGVTALALLCALQFAIAWSSVRSTMVQRAVKARPTLVLQDGRVLPDVLVQERLTEAEIRQAVRSAGSGGLEDIAGVVLETDGSLSVIPRNRLGSASALEDIRGWST